MRPYFSPPTRRKSSPAHAFKSTPDAAFKKRKGHCMIHELRATPETCFWGFFDAELPPVLRVRSGDLVRIETLTHQAGDAPDLMMDPGVEAVYRAIPIAKRGPGVHIMTGPLHVEGAQPGDTLEVRVLSMEPRLPYGTNIAAWWGHLYEDFGKERITIYRIDADSGLARAAFAFDYRTTPRYEQPGILVPADRSARQAALAEVVVPLRPHFGVGGVAPREPGRINSIPPGEFGGNVDNWRFGPGAAMYYPIFHPGALCYLGDPHMAEGDAELSGTAIEASANAVVQITVRKDLRFASPMLETPTHWIAHGFDADLNRAMKAAARALLSFLVEHKGLSRDDAYSLISVAGDFGITQVVDQRQGVHGMIAKNLFLPAVRV
jgi:formamidase